MKRNSRLLILAVAIAAVAYFSLVTWYVGSDLERGTQMFWSDKVVYIVAHRQRHGRANSLLRYARQFVTNYPYQGIPADDQIAWIEVTKVTANSVSRNIYDQTDIRPIGMLDGQIYSRPKGQLSLWNEGRPTAVSAEVAERWVAQGKMSAFSNVDGWSYVVGLLRSADTETFEMTVEGSPIRIRTVRSPDRKSIVLIRRDGSSETILDIGEDAIFLNADSYRQFVSTIPSK